MKKNLFICLICVKFLFANNYGSLLLHGNCTTCHFIDTHKSAPSLKYIKDVYKTAFPDKKAFVDYMSTWVQTPNEEGSLMIDMIDKYELMPDLAYDKETLKIIAEYIFDSDLDKEIK